MLRHLTILGVALALSAASAAAADPTSPDPDFAEGRRLLDAGDYVAACAKLKMTYDREHTAGKAFNLSVCEEKQGHVARALGWMKSGISLLPANDDRLPAAVERQGDLDKRVARLTIRTAAPAPSIVVRLDGEEAPMGEALPVDPGFHVITTSLGGHADARFEFTAAAGASSTLSVQPGAALGGSPPIIAPRRDNGIGGRRIAGIALMSAGGASFIGFGVSAGLVAKTHTDFAAATGQARLDDASMGRKLEIAEAVLLGLGIAASGTGIAVYATAPRGPGPALAPVASVSRDSCVVGVRGAY